MPLTDIEIRNAKPASKPFKLSDTGWLFLLVNPGGSKLWRIAYRFAGKEKLLSLGAYPEISLKEARARRDEAKALIAAGVDPVAHRRQAKASAAAASANTFGALADALIAKKVREQRSEATMKKVRWLLDTVRPALGSRPIAEITSREVLSTLKPVEARGKLETAARLRSTVGEVFRLGVAEGLCETDPTAALKGALAQAQVEHRAAVVEPKAFGGLLRAIADYNGEPATRLAMHLLALTFVRPGELRHAQWSEFDLDAEQPVWAIPAAKMKMRRDHLIPLAPQAVTLLTQLRALGLRGDYLFPGRTAKRCMSENTITAALRRMGVGTAEHSAHGFRSSASTMLNASGLWSPDAIEAQLAHIDSDKVRRAYNRAAYWDERVRMMRWWADHLDRLKTGGEVVQRAEAIGPARCLEGFLLVETPEGALRRMTGAELGAFVELNPWVKAWRVEGGSERSGEDEEEA